MAGSQIHAGFYCQAIAQGSASHFIALLVSFTANFAVTNLIMRHLATCMLLAMTAWQSSASQPSMALANNVEQPQHSNADAVSRIGTGPDALPTYMRCDLPAPQTTADTIASDTSGTCAWTRPGMGQVQAPFELIIPTVHTMARSEVAFQAVWWKPHDVESTSCRPQPSHNDIPACWSVAGCAAFVYCQQRQRQHLLTCRGVELDCAAAASHCPW